MPNNKKSTPKQNNVRSITSAISKLKNPAKRVPKTVTPPVTTTVPDIVVTNLTQIDLDDERNIIGNGLMALNKALFEQTIYESLRLPRLRGIVSKLENDILLNKDLSKLTDDEKLNLFLDLRKSMDNSTNFLEKMQKNSLQIMETFAIYKQLLESLSPPEEEKGALPNTVDKEKIAMARGILIDLVTKTN